MLVWRTVVSVKSVGHAVRRRLGLRRSTPRLSVVVPVYKVEEYLAACLDSLRAQTFTDFEVVLVDDGSPDSSAKIAQGYVRADPRFRIVHQENAGLGAARNTGVRESRGAYLTFLDSDDTLPPHAYAVLMETIERTGSDLVVGTLKRDDGRRRVAMRLMRENHRRRREQVTLGEMPLILADVFAVNKVYRRSFWDAADLSFPVDVRYEDQPTLTRAFVAAGRFDVIPETVYFWRVRDDGSSITQRRDDLADLRDRLLTKRVSSAAVEGTGPQVRDVWFRTILPVDMWEYFRASVQAGDEYWSLLRAGMAEFWNRETFSFQETRVPVQQRLMGWYVEHDRREDLAKLVAFLDEVGRDLPIELRNGRLVARLPGLDDPAAGVPPQVFELGPHELQWEARVTEAGWAGSHLHITGFALVRQLAPAGGRSELAGRLVRSAGAPGGSRVTRELALTAVPEPRATAFVGRPAQNFDDCGFEFVLDVSSLAEAGPGTWRIELERRIENFAVGGGIAGVQQAGAATGWREIHVGGERSTAYACLRKVDGDVVVDVRFDQG